MGRNPKYSAEQKVQACEDYLSGRKSAKEIAKELGLGKYGDGVIRNWAS